MELYSLLYISFVAVCLCVYYLVGRLVHKGQWLVLLVANLVFYCLMGTWTTLGYVVATSTITWGGAYIFSRIEAKRKRLVKQAPSKEAKKALKKLAASKKRAVLIVSILFVTGILCYVKYLGDILRFLGWGAAPKLLLPLGISFYTFMALSYLVDAYRGTVEVQDNYLKVMTYLTYFPSIIQGPINRYSTMAPQLFARHRLSEVRWTPALMQTLYGMLKKYAMADCLLFLISHFLDRYNATTPGIFVALGILLYSAQQYGDFSGGIDMVQGVSKLFGIQMDPNFRQPYFATSLGDFWRRWHISLGAWMRTYIFYPVALTKPMVALSKWATKHLGRHIGRTLAASLANILVFFIVGVWHGTAAHFIAWGLYNGIVIALADLFKPAFDWFTKITHADRFPRALHVWRIFRTFIIVNIGWYFDRIYDFSQALDAMGRTITHFFPTDFWHYLAVIDVKPLHFTVAMTLSGVTWVIVFIVSCIQERTNNGIMLHFMKLHWILRYLLLLCLLFWILISFAVVSVVGTGLGNGFMYANF